jgi:voltage-gated potassium channel
MEISRRARAGHESGDVLSAYLMFHRFARALKIANRDSGFAQIFGAALLLVIVGTLSYSINQDWSIVDAFYFAIATLTTSSIADSDLTLEGSGIKIFTVFYILIGIGILVELARQVGFAFVEVHREDQAAKQAKKDAKLDADSA